MLEFYTIHSNLRLLITLFFAFCVLFQAGSLVLSRSRFQKTRAHNLESLLELAILLQILCLSLLHGQVYMGFDSAVVAPIGYFRLRIASFVCVAVLAVLVILSNRQYWALLTLLPAIVTLPAAETLSGRAYPALFLISLLFLLLRSVHLCVLRYREIKTGLSALSVKNAVDNLHTGVLFSLTDGRVLLMSSSMQRLMTQITGEVYRNAGLFYEQLCSGAFDDACRRAELDNQLVCLLPDDTAWMFTRAELSINGRACIQLTASDVSERYRLTAELRAQNDALESRSEELKQAMAGLQRLSRERETHRAKMRAHDVLGQRLSLLLGMVRGEQPLDIGLLKSLSEGLLRELSVGPEGLSPEDELLNLQQIFGSIGVKIELEGRLPEDGARARLFVDVIRESVVNAVRHGFATQVRIRSFLEDGLWRLHICNNGHPPTRPIVEGGGIGGMREKLAPSGGTLLVKPEPRFELSITLPPQEKS